MSLLQYFGRWEEQARTVDASGACARRGRPPSQYLRMSGRRGPSGEAVMDRGRQGRANELLFALVLIAGRPERSGSRTQPRS